MLLIHKLICLFTFLNISIAVSNIYYNIPTKYGCFKILNGTHSIGCGSDIGGTNGIIYFVSNENILDKLKSQNNGLEYIILLYPNLFNKYIIEKIKKMPYVKGIVLLQSKNESFYLKLDKSSPDLFCPDQISSLYHNISYFNNCKIQKWNMAAQEIFYNDFTNFPIFLITDDQMIKYLIEDCFEKYNANILDLYSSSYSPICSIQMVFEMFAVKDSVTCLQRSQLESGISSRDHCTPLGGFNIWSLYKPTSKKVALKPKSITVLATRLDALTMFDGLSPAAESSILSVITFLAIVDTIFRYKSTQPKEQAATTSEDNNLLFLLLNGESFDNIGSSSLLFDMNVLNKFPNKLDLGLENQLALINTSHIGQIIELGQMGLAKNRTFYLHSDPIARKNVEIDSQVGKIEESFKASAAYETLMKPWSYQSGIITYRPPHPDRIIIKPVPFIPDPNNIALKITPPLPPSSLQMFLRQDPNLVGIYVADHDKEFHNNFYHSQFDTLEYVSSYHGQFKKLDMKPLLDDMIDIASCTARVLLNLVNPSFSLESSVTADSQLIQTLIDCYLVNPSCEYWKMLSYYVDLRNQKTPFPNYVSVVSQRNPFTYVTQLTVAYLTRDISKSTSDDVTTSEECSRKNQLKTDIYRYYWFQNVTKTSSTTTTPSKTSSPSVQEPAVSPKPSFMCVATLTDVSLAQSPAFSMSKLYGDISDAPIKLPDYDLVRNVDRYSTWVESTWSGEPKLRVYLATNSRLDWYLFFAGFFFCAFTWFIIYVAKKYKRILFEGSLIDPRLSRAGDSPITADNGHVPADVLIPSLTSTTKSNQPENISVGEDGSEPAVKDYENVKDVREATEEE